MGERQVRCGIAWEAGSTDAVPRERTRVASNMEPPMHERALVSGLHERLVALWIGGKDGRNGNWCIAFREHWSHSTDESVSARKDLSPSEHDLQLRAIGRR